MPDRDRSAREGFATCFHGRTAFRVSFLAIFLLASGLSSCVVLSSRTHLEFTDMEREKDILALTLGDGEGAVLTWRNSHFGLDVTERFVAERGMLVLTEVSFSDPAGGIPGSVRPQDLEDLYHTGGPFSVKGLHKEFSEVIFRIGEVGHPRLYVKGRTIALKEAAGFGGRVRLRVRKASLYERIFE